MLSIFNKEFEFLVHDSQIWKISICEFQISDPSVFKDMQKRMQFFTFTPNENSGTFYVHANEQSNMNQPYLKSLTKSQASLLC